jgi:hypothetical protein
MRSRLVWDEYLERDQPNPSTCRWARHWVGIPGWEEPSVKRAVRGRPVAEVVPQGLSTADSLPPFMLAPEVAPFSPPPEVPVAAVAVPSTSTGPVAEAAVDRSTPEVADLPVLTFPAVEEAVTFQPAVEAVAEGRFPQAVAVVEEAVTFQPAVAVVGAAADITNSLVEAPILVVGSNQPKPQPSPWGEGGRRRRPDEGLLSRICAAPPMMKMRAAP